VNAIQLSFNFALLSFELKKTHLEGKHDFHYTCMVAAKEKKTP
jgi:hypothetical protein